MASLEECHELGTAWSMTLESGITGAVDWARHCSSTGLGFLSVEWGWKPVLKGSCEP